jgi:TolB-like protein
MKGIRVIGALLGFQSVLEMSFRGHEKKVRVIARLTEVTTGFALWSKTFNSRVEEVFAGRRRDRAVHRRRISS